MAEREPSPPNIISSTRQCVQLDAVLAKTTPGRSWLFEAVAYYLGGRLARLTIIHGKNCRGKKTAADTSVASAKYGKTPKWWKRRRSSRWTKSSNLPLSAALRPRLMLAASSRQMPLQAKVQPDKGASLTSGTLEVEAAEAAKPRKGAGKNDA